MIYSYASHISTLQKQKKKRGGKSEEEKEKERGKERANSSFYGSLIFVWL